MFVVFADRQMMNILSMQSRIIVFAFWHFFCFPSKIFKVLPDEFCNVDGINQSVVVVVVILFSVSHIVGPEFEVQGCLPNAFLRFRVGVLWKMSLNQLIEQVLPALGLSRVVSSCGLVLVDREEGVDGGRGELGEGRQARGDDNI